MMWHDGGWYGGTSSAEWVMLAVMIALLAGVVVAIVLLARSLQTGRPPAPAVHGGPPPMPPTAGPGEQPTAVTPPADPALEVLRRRYAAGEVDRDEYLRRLADLGGPAAPPPADDQS